MSVCINPFFVSRYASASEEKPGYARLPRAPRNTSPVPHLTSLYHFDDPGTYGNRRYPGNCNGMLIRDLIRFFDARNVLDPMTGGGTCADVCRELGIPCESRDIRQAFDATNPDCFQSLAGRAPFDFIWLHPPYWRQKLYTANPGDLSRAGTLADFLRGYEALIRNCASVLSPDGKLAVLMGDYPDREAGFVPLAYHTKRLAFDAGLRQACTDIIRFSHGTSSSRKTYRSSFIPTLHDVCMVFEKPTGR